MPFILHKLNVWTQKISREGKPIKQRLITTLQLKVVDKDT